MKLLLDQNVSPKLVKRLADLYPGSNQVMYLGFDESSDTEICRLAFDESYVIVTKDADYSEMLSIKSHLPKIIWIRKGNCSNEDVEHLLRQYSEQINGLETNETLRILILF